MINVKGREKIKRVMINQRFSCRLIKGCFGQKKEEKKHRIESEKLFIDQAN